MRRERPKPSAARRRRRGTRWTPLLARERHRHHRHRRGRADPDEGADRSGRCGRGATGRCSSSTSPCRATSRRRPARSSRSSSTTSTTCRRPCARTSRAAPARSRAPKRSSAKRSTSSAAWLRSRGAIPTVVALRQRFESIRRAELERLDSQAGAALPPDARARVDEITRLIVEKLLLTPTEQLKALGDADTRRRVFGSADAPVRARASAERQEHGATEARSDASAQPLARAGTARVEPFIGPGQR